MKIRRWQVLCVVSFLTATVSMGAAAQTPTAAVAPAPTEPVAPAAPPAPVYKDGFIKVGEELKQTSGKVTDVDKGDNGCYLTLVNEKKVEFIEVGKFELCSQKAAIKGKKVALAYSLETIQAASCYGDPKCKKTEVVALVIGVKVVE